MQFTTGFSRENYIWKHHWMLFRSLKCTEGHDAKILCSHFESSGPPTCVRGTQFFIPGTQLTLIYPLGFSVGEKMFNKKQKILFVNEFELVRSFISRTRIIQQMHSAKRKMVQQNNWIKTKSTSKYEANVITAPNIWRQHGNLVATGQRWNVVCFSESMSPPTEHGYRMHIIDVKCSRDLIKTC